MQQRSELSEDQKDLLPKIYGAAWRHRRKQIQEAPSSHSYSVIVVAANSYSYSSSPEFAVATNSFRRSVVASIATAPPQICCRHHRNSVVVVVAAIKNALPLATRSYCADEASKTAAFCLLPPNQPASQQTEKIASFWTRTKMKGSPNVFDNTKSLQIQGSLTKSTTSKRAAAAAAGLLLHEMGTAS